MLGSELMGKYGVNVPKGIAISSVDEVKNAIQDVFPKENEDCREDAWTDTCYQTNQSPRQSSQQGSVASAAKAKHWRNLLSICHYSSENL
ncbi:hypothetical protein L1049_028606 [Liquidambar formosana]|uniref:Uncharacterized protein n=1 Tax=Liquidambar formosana TaxID=63359 RepID=A0AAP0N8C2_LIQFO